MLIILPPFLSGHVPEQNIITDISPLCIWHGKSAGYTIAWMSKNISASKLENINTEESFNLKDCIESVFEKQRQELIKETGNVGQCNLATYYKIVSVVGQYLCLHEQFLGVYEATKSLSKKTFRTIDLAKATKKSPLPHSIDDYEILLTDIASEQAIIAALLANPLIRQALRTKGIEEIVTAKKNAFSSIKDFIDTMQERNVVIEDASGNKNYSFNIDLRNFVIHHTNGTMGVRLLLPNPTILADMPLQLDLHISISDSVLQRALENADTKTEGFLMDKRNPTLKETTTIFRRILLPPYDKFITS